MTETTGDVLKQLTCAALLFIVAAGIGSVLPITACLVCVGGTIVAIYLYRCMRGQTWRRSFLAIALLWLWANTALTLFAHREVLLAASLLTIGAVSLPIGGHRERLGAFFIPIGSLSLIGYGMRDFESGMVMAIVAGALIILGFLWHLYRVYIISRYPTKARLLRILPHVFILLASAFAPGLLFLSLLDILPDMLPRQLSACGVINKWWTAALCTFSYLAPLGIINFTYNFFL